MRIVTFIVFVINCFFSSYVAFSAEQFSRTQKVTNPKFFEGILRKQEEIILEREEKKRQQSSWFFNPITTLSDNLTSAYYYTTEQPTFSHYKEIPSQELKIDGGWGLDKLIIGHYSKRTCGVDGSTFCSFRESDLYKPQSEVAHSLDGYDVRRKGDFFYGGLGDGCGGHYSDKEDKDIAEMAYLAPKTMNDYVGDKLELLLKTPYSLEYYMDPISANVRNILTQGFKEVGTKLTQVPGYSKHQPQTTFVYYTAIPYQTKSDQRAYQIEGFNFGDSMALLYSLTEGVKTMSPAMTFRGGTAQYPMFAQIVGLEYRPFTTKASSGDYIILCSDGVTDCLPSTITQSGEDGVEITTLDEEKINDELCNCLTSDQAENVLNFTTAFTQYALDKTNAARKIALHERATHGDDFTMVVTQLK